MSTEDLYGLRSDDLESAREAVEEAFGIALEPRNSSYHGGDYFHGRSGTRDEFLLQVNDDGEDGWAEEDFQDFGVLLSVYSPDDGDRYRKAIAGPNAGFVLLERSVTTPSRLLRRMRYVDGREEVVFEKQLDAPSAPHARNGNSEPPHPSGVGAINAEAR